MRLRDYNSLTEYDKFCIAYDYGTHLLKEKEILAKHEISHKTLIQVLTYEYTNTSKSL